MSYLCRLPSRNACVHPEFAGFYQPNQNIIDLHMFVESFDCMITFDIKHKIIKQGWDIGCIHSYTIQGISWH